MSPASEHGESCVSPRRMRRPATAWGGSARQMVQRRPTSAPSLISAVIHVWVGWRRRSVGEPGLSSRSPLGAVVSQGMWLCPNTSTSTSGYAAAQRRSRPAAPPVSCTTASRTPSSSARATSGSRARSGGPSLLPHTPTSRAARSSSASRSSTDTQSPACTTTSAASTASHTGAGRSRARAGTCVSEISNSFRRRRPGPPRRSAFRRVGSPRPHRGRRRPGAAGSPGGACRRPSCPRHPGPIPR
jgi:hypothetical protein